MGVNQYIQGNRVHGLPSPLLYMDFGGRSSGTSSPNAICRDDDVVNRDRAGIAFTDGTTRSALQLATTHSRATTAALF
jgi:hypothetical protein